MGLYTGRGSSLLSVPWLRHDPNCFLLSLPGAVLEQGEAWVLDVLVFCSNCDCADQVAVAVT